MLNLGNIKKDELIEAFNGLRNFDVNVKARNSRQVLQLKNTEHAIRLRYIDAKKN